MTTPAMATYRVALTSRPSAARLGPREFSATTYVLAVMGGDAEIGSMAISMAGPFQCQGGLAQISGKTAPNFEGLSEPRLHGYMVSLVPACPNPDETLFGVQ